MENTQKVTGWKDIQLTPNESAATLIDFLNILNQRLATIENLMVIPDESGKMISLTDLYERQSLQAMQAAANNENKENK